MAWPQGCTPHRPGQRGQRAGREPAPRQRAQSLESGSGSREAAPQGRTPLHRGRPCAHPNISRDCDFRDGTEGAVVGPVLPPHLCAEPRDLLHLGTGSSQV